MKIALCNFTPRYGSLEENTKTIAALSRLAANQGAEMVCFPEMSLTGYASSSWITDYAQTADGNWLKPIQHLAAEQHIAIMAGIPELDCQTNLLYITHFCCKPDGQVDFYRKTHLSKREAALFHAGDQIGVMDVKGIKVAIQLCYEAHFPEMALAQASAGAEVIVICSASPMGDSVQLHQRWLRYLPARAYDTGCYVLTCNQHGVSPCGRPYFGCAMAFNPDGELMDWDHSPNGLLIINIQRDAVRIARCKRSFLAHRRPDLYKNFLSKQGAFKYAAESN